MASQSRTLFLSLVNGDNLKGVQSAGIFVNPSLTLGISAITESSTVITSIIANMIREEVEDLQLGRHEQHKLAAELQKQQATELTIQPIPRKLMRIKY